MERSKPSSMSSPACVLLSTRRPLSQYPLADLLMMPKRGERKKGEEEKKKTGQAAEGKTVVVYQEKSKKFDQPKLLASSTSAAAAHRVRVTAAADTANLNIDATLASTLEAMQSFLMADVGVMEIPQVKPIQVVPSEAIVPAAPLKAITAPPAKIQAKATPPKTAPTKTTSKRPAPTSKEAHPAAKRQKIQASLTAKTSRLAEKKKEEEEKRKEAERKEAVKHARLKKVEERATKLLNENMLVQASPMRSGYIPFTPDESEVCNIQADIDACRITIKEMVESNRYTQDEQDFIRKFINRKASTFNSEQSERFRSLLKELTERSFVMDLYTRKQAF